MARIRNNARERRTEPSNSPSPVSEAFVSTLGQTDSDVALRFVEEGEPAGFGVEETTASGNLVVLGELEIPPGRQAELVEVSVAIEANGEALVSLRGLTFGPYIGAIEASIPFGDANLLEGDRIRVLHRSTDGADTTTRAQVTARLF